MEKKSLKLLLEILFEKCIPVWKTKKQQLGGIICDLYRDVTVLIYIYLNKVHPYVAIFGAFSAFV